MLGPSWKVVRVQQKGTQAVYLLSPSFSCMLARSLPLTGLSRSFRPTRSFALSSPRPSRSFRPTRSLLPLCSLGSVGHSGPLSPLLPLYLFSLLFSLLLHHCLDSVGHSGPLGLWQPPLSSLLTPSSLFHLSLNPVGHSGPLGSWQPLFLFSHTLPPLSPFSSFFSTARTQSVIPAHSVFGNLLSLPFAFLPLSPKPEPSRSFRPTRFLATSHLLSSSPFPGLHVITATTQSVIPAHSVTGFTSEHCAGQRYGHDCAGDVQV